MQRGEKCARGITEFFHRVKPMLNLPETKAGKIMAGGSIASVLAAALLLGQVGEVFVLREPYAADMVMVQLQIVDVQIIQANAELNAITQRETMGQASPADLAQKQILIQRISDLQKVRREMVKK